MLVHTLCVIIVDMYLCTYNKIPDDNNSNVTLTHAKHNYLMNQEIG